MLSACVALSCCAVGAQAMQVRLFTVYSPSTTCDDFGSTVKRVGDVNGDKVPDLLVSASRSLSRPIRGGLYLVSGRDGSLLHAMLPRRGASFDRSWPGPACGLGDVDGDGRGDFAAQRFEYVSFNVYRLMVSVYSGANLKHLYDVLGRQPSDLFGVALHQIGDVDGDGVSDAAAAVSKAPYYVRVFSGKTGRTIRDHVGSFGWAAAAAGDLDRDGYGEIALGDAGADHNGKNSGSVYFYSGKTGKLLRRWDGSRADEGFGLDLASVGDVDGDKVPDLLVGIRRHFQSPVSQSGAARVLSGKDGRVLFQWNGRKYQDGFGWRVAAAGDTNGDGKPDFLIWNDFKVDLYSGTDGRRLKRFDSDADRTSTGFGASFDGIGDVNGDGLADIAVGEPCSAGWPLRPPSLVHIFGGGFTALTADKKTLSLAKNESLTFRLDARKVHAGKWYLMLGGLSGTRPGLPIGVVSLPLVFDAYSNLTLTWPNRLLLRRSFVPLNALGKGTCTLTLEPYVPRGLAGLSVWHAFVVLDPRKSTIDFASNAVGVKILP